VQTCDNKLYAVKNKEDQNVRAYGVHNNHPCNLKTISKGAKLPSSEPITVEYQKSQKVITFKSKIFEYRRTGLSDGISYAIFVFLGDYEMKVQAEIQYCE
jgi:hypothetical protein